MTDKSIAEQAIERGLREAREARQRVTDGLQASERKRLENYLAEGGRVEREDHGGSVGVVWHSITRSERPWCGSVGDELRAAGEFVHKGEAQTIRTGLHGEAQRMWAG